MAASAQVPPELDPEPGGSSSSSSPVLPPRPPRVAELEDWLRDHEPNSYQALEELGLLYHSLGLWSKSVPCLQKACDLVGRIPGAALVDPGRVWRNLGFGLFRLWEGDVEGSDSLLERSSACLKESMGFEENASSFEILTTISRCFECLGDFGGAVQVMTNLSMDFPGHPRLGDAMLFAGCICFHSQAAAYPQAVRYIEYIMTLEEKPGCYTDMEYSFLLSRAYELSGRKGEAKEGYAEIFKQGRSSGSISFRSMKEWLRSPSLWRSKAELYERNFHFAAASDAWMKFVRRSRKGQDLSLKDWLAVARSFRLCGERSNAVSCAKRAQAIFMYDPFTRKCLKSWGGEDLRNSLVREDVAALDIQRVLYRGRKGRLAGRAHMHRERAYRGGRRVAATKIQSCFRGYIFRKRAYEYKEHCESLVRKSVRRIAMRILLNAWTVWSFTAKQRGKFKSILFRANSASKAWVFDIWKRWLKEHLARKAADEAKRLEYERKVKRSLWKIQNAQKVKAFETLREYARMSKRVKRMARRALLERTGYYYQRWREHVLDLIDERVIASETGILVERPTRPVGATQLKLQMQVLKACHSATATANTVVSRGADLSTADVRVISSMLKSRALLVYNAPRFRSGGVEALGRVLGGVEGCLSTLSLSDCNLDTRAARVLSAALREETCRLQKLHLYSGPRIGDKGCSLLAGALRHSPCLSELCLSGVGLTDAGAMDLADALRSSRNLTTLDLSGNSVGVAGGKALADVLVSGNRTIKNLRLGSQTEQLGDEVAFAFSRVLLSRADSLWELDLRSSSIGPAGARSLAEALRAPAKLFDAGANEEQAECKAGDSSSKPPPLARTGSHLALSVTRPDGGFTASKIKILNLMSNRVDDAGACLLIASIEERGYGMQLSLDNNPSISPLTHTKALALQHLKPNSTLEMCMPKFGLSAWGPKTSHVQRPMGPPTDDFITFRSTATEGGASALRLDPLPISDARARRLFAEARVRADFEADGTEEGDRWVEWHDRGGASFLHNVASGENKAKVQATESALGTGVGAVTSRALPSLLLSPVAPSLLGKRPSSPLKAFHDTFSVVKQATARGPSDGD